MICVEWRTGKYEEMSKELLGLMMLDSEVRHILDLDTGELLK